jgi:hypothetical protein
MDTQGYTLCDVKQIKQGEEKKYFHDGNPAVSLLADGGMLRH